MKREVDAAEVLSATLPGEASDFDKFFCTFPLKKIQFCGDGQIAAMVDTQDQIYLWNSVIHRLVGQISFHQLDALKAQTPVILVHGSASNGCRLFSGKMSEGTPVLVLNIGNVMQIDRKSLLTA